MGGDPGEKAKLITQLKLPFACQERGLIKKKQTKMKPFDKNLWLHLKYKLFVLTWNETGVSIMLQEIDACWITPLTFSGIYWLYA